MKHYFILLIIFAIGSFHIYGQTCFPTHFDTGKTEKNEWEGFERIDFFYNGRETTVVIPHQESEGKPWIWRPAFFGAFPSVDKALLDKGFHVVYYDLTHLYGSPRAIQLGNTFYNYLVDSCHFSPKVTLEGFSRGGLFVFNWAAKNPEKVACIYVDAPVCDVFSWPGRQNRELWEGVLKEWQMTEEEMKVFPGNPVNNLQPLMDASIPVIAVCGDSDRTVPYEENMKIVYEKLLAGDVPVKLILKEGVDHHPHSLEDPSPVVDFILKYP